MKNFKSCAGFCSVVALLILFTVAAVTWAVLEFEGNRLAQWTIIGVVVAVILGTVVLYAKVHTKRFLAAVQKKRPDSLAFWATAPPEMVHPFGVSYSDIDAHGPEAVVVAASREAFEIWMNMELKGPTRSLPNTQDLKFNRGIYHFGVFIRGDSEYGTRHEEDIYNEAIEIRNPNGDDLVFKTEDLNATWEAIQQLRH